MASNEHDKWKVENSHTSAGIRHGVPRRVHSHEILVKTHTLLVFLACQAKLGMTTRVRDGPIALDDSDRQSLEVARLVVTGQFMIRIDHLIYNEFCV